MTIKSSSEILEVAKEVVDSGKKRYVEYNENEMIYDFRKTKLGLLREDFKNGNFGIISQLYYELNKGIYPNKPFQGMLIERLDKPNKPRMIKIPAVSDRIVYSLLLKKIEPLFNKDVQKYPIYGLKNKGVALAMRELKSVVKPEVVVLKLDFQSYFDTIPRAKLLDKLRKYKLSGEDLKLLKAAINAPTNVPKQPKSLALKHGHKFMPYETKIGLPQGCAFSPLLASVYALEIEEYLKQNNIVSIRYIDDIIIFTKTVDSAKEIYTNLKDISDGLGLILHPPKIGEVNDKSYISQANTALRFLGLDIFNGSTSLPEDKIKKFITVLEERLAENLTGEEDIRYRDSSIVSFIIGWTKYYRDHADDWSDKREMVLELAIKSVVNSAIKETTKTRFSLILKRELCK